MLKNLYSNTPTVILAHNYVGEIIGKTINGLLMHSKLFNIVALVDKAKAGMDASKICSGVTRKVPIYDNIEKAFFSNPKVLIIIGEPSESNKDEIITCINRGMDIINSSFKFLTDFSHFVEVAQKNNTKLHDLRNIQKDYKDADGSILNINAKVVFVTGTDCGLGKRTAAYELVQEARKRGVRAAFAATGQTGLMIGCDSGIVFDALPMNFAVGAIEQMLLDLDKKGFELIFLEGQASLMHYAYSCSIALLHGSNPHAIVMVHDDFRKQHAAMGNSPIFEMCDFKREIHVIENLYLPRGNKFKVVAIATIGEQNIRTIRQKTSLPVADARTENGPAILLDAVLNHLKSEYQWEPLYCFCN